MSVQWQAAGLGNYRLYLLHSIFFPSAAGEYRNVSLVQLPQWAFPELIAGWFIRSAMSHTYSILRSLENANTGEKRREEKTNIWPSYNR
jgi:hypothetical protein